MLKFENKKNLRYFYVYNYRRVLKLLMFSLIGNVLLFVLISYVYFNESRPNYYGTNGATNPVLLKSMTTPNYSSQALLPDDIPADAKPVTNL